MFQEGMGKILPSALIGNMFTILMRPCSLVCNLHMQLTKGILTYDFTGCRCQYSGIWYANVASLLLINSLETKHLIGLVGSILAEILMVWHKLDERTRNMYTLDITIFGALMILLSYGQTGNKLRTAAYETFDAKPVCI